MTEQSKQVEGRLSGRRILVVEDEGLTQMHLQRLLKQHGAAQVAQAFDGARGVETARAMRPDIILMDVSMPEMDGFTATREILASFETCVIMLTALSERDYEEEARTVGAAGYITKPISGAALIPEIEEAYKRFCQAKSGVKID